MKKEKHILIVFSFNTLPSTIKRIVGGFSLYLIENCFIGLIPYTHDDDYGMYHCWCDLDTQKAYNGIFCETHEEFIHFEITRFQF
jgi:hypothetical protein